MSENDIQEFVSKIDDKEKIVFYVYDTPNCLNDYKWFTSITIIYFSSIEKLRSLLEKTLKYKIYT